MDQPEFEDAYTAQFGLRSDLGAAAERILRELLGAEAISTLSITHRVKTRESALKKLATKNLTSIEQMTDVVGLRVITYLRDEVDEVAKIVEREFTIDEENSVDKRGTLDPDRFGYLSVHYIASLSAARVALPEYRRFENVRFELQIRSVLQHAWAEIEHDIGYKSESAVPRNERRAFSRLAGMLEMADDEFVRIRDRLAERQAAIAEEVARGDVGVEIDQDAIYALLTSGDDTLSRMDLAIARFGAGAEAITGMADREYAGARATQLRRCGLEVLGDVWRLLENHEDEVLEYTRRWLQYDYPASAELPTLPESEDEIEPDALYRQPPERLAELSWPRGLTLYYLARYLAAAEALQAYLVDGQWKDQTFEEKASAACLAAARGIDPVPLT
jgi:putative GTP pyrophosphokinase